MKFNKTLICVALLALFSEQAAIAATAYQIRFFAPGVKAAQSPAIKFRDSGNAIVSSLTFPSVLVGGISTSTYTVTNQTASAITLGATPFGVSAPFSVSSTTCSGTLAAAASCSVTFSYAPTTDQPDSSLVYFNSSLGSIYVPSLSASATVSLAAQVVQGDSTTFIQKADGTWEATGTNGNGEMGIGSTTGTAYFVPIPALTGFVQVVSHRGSTFAKKSDGTWWSTGKNVAGTLGLGDTVNRTSFTQVPGLNGATRVVMSDFQAYARLANGTWVGCGSNSSGNLGLGDATLRTSFTAIPFLADAIDVVPSLATYAKKPNGTWWAAGDNLQGNFGIGSFGGTSSTFVQIPGIDNATEIVSSGYGAFAHLASGTWAVAGQTSSGGFSLFPGTRVNTFTGVSAFDNATSIVYRGDSTYAHLNDGTWLVAGNNSAGQLGVGSTSNKWPPVAAPALTGIASIVGLGTNSIAAYYLTGGKVYATGWNSVGQLLGNGTTVSPTTWTRVYP